MLIGLLRHVSTVFAVTPTQRLLAAGADPLPTYLDQCQAAPETQLETLLDIVGRSADTEWGRAHDFSGVRSVDDFRARVPLTEWSDYEAVSERMQEGETNLTFPGAPEFFVLTSGTTGFSKLIPESAAGLAAKRATSDLRIAAVVPHVPSLRDEGAILTFANRRVFGTTPSGIEFGSASGSNLTLSPPLGPSRLAYPLSILERVDHEHDVDYLILLCALGADVRAIRGNNAGRLITLLEAADARRDDLISDIRHGTITPSITLEPELRASLTQRPNPARADALDAAIAERGHLDAAAAWPNLAALIFWLSGSVGRYMADLLPHAPSGVTTFDIGYGASEGRFNVPLNPGVSAGPLALHAQFLEFVPLDGGDPLLAHEVSDGASYRLVTTSYSGLYRYDIHDIVRVDGFTGGSPHIVFESKGADVGNVAGEKIAGSELMREIDAALLQAGLTVRHYCVVTDLDRHGYDVCLELDPASAPPPANLADIIEAALTRTGMIYPYFRGQGLIAPSRTLVMASGWQEQLYATRTGAGVSRSQVKLPLIVLEVPHPSLTTVALMSSAPTPD